MLHDNFKKAAVLHLHALSQLSKHPQMVQVTDDLSRITTQFIVPGLEIIKLFNNRHRQHYNIVGK